MYALTFNISLSACLESCSAYIYFYIWGIYTTSYQSVAQHVISKVAVHYSHNHTAHIDILQIRDTSGAVIGHVYIYILFYTLQLYI